MVLGHSMAKVERERKLKAVLSFASTLTDRFKSSRDLSLTDDLQTHIRCLPLQASSAVTAKHDELDKSGTELWNLSTRLRRHDNIQLDGRNKEDETQKKGVLGLLRVFAFLLLDSAGGQATRGREQKTCIRLMNVALKAARICIESNDLDNATKVLERAADYQEALSKDMKGKRNEETQLGDRLRVEYFAVRITLAWRQDRLDTAEHMYSKSKQLNYALNSSTAEKIADMLYEVGKDLLKKRNYELGIRWLERSYDVIGEQELEMLSSEAGDLRLSIMQSITHAYMKIKDSDAHSKAWDMVKLLDIDYGGKLAVSLLKLELLSAEEAIDSAQMYAVLLQMIRVVVLNETNFKTIMHYVHKLKEHSAVTSCKVLDDLIEIRLFQEDNQGWIEKALITRIWITTTSPSLENCLEMLKMLFDTVQQNTKYPLTAPATHAAQTLLWKRVEVAYSQGQYALAESWCHICLHILFEKAGEMNKCKIARKVILCASARQDYVAAREVFNKMSDTGKDESITRYLMYKAALQGGDTVFISECLDTVCRHSSRDATLLYACVLEAQNAGDKQQTIIALQKVLQKYDYSAPPGVHLPALLRCTSRLLIAELIKDGKLSPEVLDQICIVFEGACTQAKLSRRRPAPPTQQLFTPSEFEWFSKNAYNLSLKYCAEIHPHSLVRLLNVCIEFIKILQEQKGKAEHGELALRLLFCDFLAACAFTTLARAEDNIQASLQHYIQVRNHGQEFRRIATEELQIEHQGESAKFDIISKHFQVVKLEVEAVLKLERWDSLEDLFEECWKYKSPDHYETLADLVLLAHSCVVSANQDAKYQGKILMVLQKIINLSWRVSGNNIVKLARWIRCLFQLALAFDESISLKCLDQAAQLASSRHGTPDRYPLVEIEWLATTSFNLGVDYYVQEEDTKAKTWAGKALSLTEWVEDGGQLKDSLLEKYSKLIWDK